VPAAIGGYALADVRQLSLELLVERFAPVLKACEKYGVTFDLECHPSERAMGDLESAADYLQALDRAGYGAVAGFNLDGSHLEWQGVSTVHFIREFGDRIHCAHIKGVQVIREHTRAGLLGGHRPMGYRHNGWNFVTAGSQRDANSIEEILIELNRAGYDGAINVEWEDNDVEQHAGAKSALANVRRTDLPPSTMRHDDMLRA
jgi:sugar phosphate isomerase/epimerase